MSTAVASGVVHLVMRQLRRLRRRRQLDVGRSDGKAVVAVTLGLKAAVTKQQAAALVPVVAVSLYVVAAVAPAVRAIEGVVV